MLQQTRVETVKGYYQRFLAAFPDVRALAQAPEAEVLKQWEGLGYYSRARNLQKAACAILLTHGGNFPSTHTALLTLPGIGAYTAAAIASIVFGEAKPAVDGNVKRVAARLFGERERIDSPATLARITQRLTQAIPHDQPGAFNQAMMELGATLCLPRSPRCESCPVATYCDACAEGDQESLPIHEKKRPPQEVPVAVCLLTAGERVLVVRRTQRLLHGLYVFWLLEGETDVNQIERLLAEAGLPAKAQQALGEARHIFTHRVWQMRLWRFALLQPPDEHWLAQQGAMLVDAQALAQLPLPTAMKAAREAALAWLAPQKPEPT